jgi:carboxymethylenebutenolidase
MNETQIDIPTKSGSMSTLVVAPEEGGPHPAVLVLMDAPGIRESLREIARRIASAGYVTLLPDLYYRIGRDISVGPTRNHPDAERNLQAMLAHVRSLSNAMVIEDVGAALDFLSRDARVLPGPVGAVGYCMSGGFVFAAAAAFPPRIACAASFYGTKLVTPRDDSPHLAASRIEAEMYFAFAENDSYVPPEQVEALRAHLAGTKLRHRIEVYPGTQHGFAFPDRGSYQRAGAERHWESLFALLRRNLGSAA